MPIDFTSTLTVAQMEAVFTAFRTLDAAGLGWIPNRTRADIVTTENGNKLTIQPKAVTLAKMADLATQTLIGRASALTGQPQALTPAQVAAMLPAFSAALAGLVPAPSTGAKQMLTSDGWEVIAGGGTGGGTPTLNPDPAGTAAAYKAGTDTHSHGSTPLGTEHVRVMALVPLASVDRVAVNNGSWFTASTWYPSGVPVANERVGIPDEYTVTYDQISATVLKTVRVDGVLQFSKTVQTKLVVDTLIITPTGTLEIGTATAPCTATCEILFPGGNIDTAFDPYLFSRGCISHGKVSVFGIAKTPFQKIANLSAGATQFTPLEAVTAWAVGDEIVIPGTRKKGWYNGATDPYPILWTQSEDERVRITAISGGTITFTPALAYPHVPPTPYYAYAVNITRNVWFESPAGLPVHQRGHTMFMHSNQVACYYASFTNLGRTDKSQPASDIDTFTPALLNSNSKGRYPVHLHKTGTLTTATPGIVEGCVVDFTAGWGFAHHSSHAEFNKCVSWDCFGAGFAAEDGDETGIWQDCFAVRGKGIGWGESNEKLGPDVVTRHDNFRCGDGFGLGSRLVKIKRCIAANCTHGFVWMHRYMPTNPLAVNLENPAIAYGATSMEVAWPPIHGFDDNEAFGSEVGMIVIKADNKQHHDVRTLLPNFRAWETRIGAQLEYTGHYTILGWKLRGTAAADSGAQAGIEVLNNAFDMVFKDCRCENFNLGCLTPEDFTYTVTDDDYQRIFIDQVFVGCTTNYQGFTAPRTQYLTAASLVPGRLTFTQTSGNTIELGDPYELTGTKVDSIGSRNRVIADDRVQFDWNKKFGPMANNIGYWTRAGKPVFVIKDLIADRVTGQLLTREFELTINCTVAAFLSQYDVALFGGAVNKNLGVLP